MKKNNKGIASIIVVLIVVVVLALGGIGYKILSSSKIVSLPEKPVSENLVGGDRDAHGCIGSAGYSWCEFKTKCLRTWEEKCEVTSTTSVTDTKNWKTYRNETKGVEFSYPASWTYQKFSCNLDGVAFCPFDAKLGLLNCGMTCSMESRGSPVYFYYDNLSANVKDLELHDKKYSEIYDYMVSTFRSI